MVLDDKEKDRRAVSAVELERTKITSPVVTDYTTV